MKKYDKKISYWLKHAEGQYVGIWTLFSFWVGDSLNELVNKTMHIDSFIIKAVIGITSIMVIWFVAAKLFEKKTTER